MDILSKVKALLNRGKDRGGEKNHNLPKQYRDKPYFYSTEHKSIARIEDVVNNHNWYFTLCDRYGNPLDRDNLICAKIPLTSISEWLWFNIGEHES